MSYEALCGWAGPEEAKRAFDWLMKLQKQTTHPLEQLGWLFYDAFKVVGDPVQTEKRVALWDAVRKVTGKDTPNYAQETGDCCSFGEKNVAEYLQCQEIAAGDREEFHAVFPPYSYGASRVLVGGGRLRGAGSTGAWTAAAAMKYGHLRADLENVPKYSGRVADSWGYSGPPKEFVDIAQVHVVQSAAVVNNAEEAATALRNYYPLTIASNQGFEMSAGSDGFHDPRGSWAHQMSVVYYNEEPEPHFGILNSWGDVHGKVKDFTTDDVWPAGMLRVRASALDRMIKSGECFAFSNLTGFPARGVDYRPW